MTLANPDLLHPDAVNGNANISEVHLVKSDSPVSCLIGLISMPGDFVDEEIAQTLVLWHGRVGAHNDTAVV